MDFSICEQWTILPSISIVLHFEKKLSMQLQWFRNPEEFEIRIGSGLEIILSEKLWLMGCFEDHEGLNNFFALLGCPGPLTKERTMVPWMSTQT